MIYDPKILRFGSNKQLPSLFALHTGSSFTEYLQGEYYNSRKGAVVRPSQERHMGDVYHERHREAHKADIALVLHT